MKNQIGIIGISLTLVGISHGAIIFNPTAANGAAVAADLNGATSGTVGPNASTGSWTVTKNGEAPTSQFVANTGGTDYGYALDKANANSFVQLDLSTALTFDNALTISFDMAAARTGKFKSFAMIGLGSGDDEVFRYDWELGLGNTSNLSAVGAPTFGGSGFVHLNTGSETYDPSVMASFSVTLDTVTSLLPLIYDAEGFSPAGTSILNSQTDLKGIQFLVNGTNSNNAQGFWLDNVSISQVPEPSVVSLLGLGLGLSGLLVRRRRS